MAKTEFDKTISLYADYGTLFQFLNEYWDFLYPDEKGLITIDFCIDNWDSPEVAYFSDIEITIFYEYDNWLNEFLNGFQTYLKEVQGLEE